MRALHQELTDCFRSMIGEDVLAGSEKVPERELCEKMGACQRCPVERIETGSRSQIMSAERWQQAVDEHELIIQALEKRDGERLSAILNKHIENKCTAVRQWLEDQA